MTWQEPGGQPPGGTGPGSDGDDPSLDETRADWPVPDAAPPPATPPGPATPPASVPSSQPDGPVPPPVAQPPVPTSPPGPGPAGGWSPGGASPAGSYPPGGSYPPPGGAYPPGSYPPGSVPPTMGWAPAPGQGAYAPVAGLRFAGVGERFVAWLIDGFILALITLPVGMVLGLAMLGSVDWSTMIGAGYNGYGSFLDEGWIARSAGVSLAGAVIGVVVNAAYFVFQWSSGSRATLGMRVLGLQLGNASDGRTIGRGQAARRWVAMGEWLSIVAALPAIGALASLAQLGWYLVLLVTTASNPQRRGLHDQFGETAIVADAGRSNSGLIMGCLLLAVLLFVVLPIVAIVGLIFLGGQVSSILSTVGESI